MSQAHIQDAHALLLVCSSIGFLALFDNTVSVSDDATEPAEALDTEVRDDNTSQESSHAMSVDGAFFSILLYEVLNLYLL